VCVVSSSKIGFGVSSSAFGGAAALVESGRLRISRIFFMRPCMASEDVDGSAESL